MLICLSFGSNIFPSFFDLQLINQAEMRFEFFSLGAIQMGPGFFRLEQNQKIHKN